MEYITSFRGKHAFLSNFYACRVDMFIDGEELSFSSSEAAFQALKCPERAKEFIGLTGSQAKKLGKSVTLRKDWNDLRVGIMLIVIRAKFQQNPYLMERLVNTSEYLIEGNTWNDTFWGMCNDRGENWLGRILVIVRDEERECRGLEPFYKEWKDLL